MPVQPVVGVALILSVMASASATAQRPDSTGIGGHYATAVTLGDNSCGEVTVRPLPTTIQHVPGDTAFTLAHGPLTYAGTLARDGSFTTRALTLQSPEGATTVSIAGRFTPGAFDATVRIDIARQPPCRYLVQWAGRRGAPAPAGQGAAPAPAVTPALDLTPPGPATFAIVGASVIPMDRERVLARHTVVVRDGRIAAVGPDGRVAIPAGATRIDAMGKFLIPGLADMHVHLFDRNELAVYVANGITTVRNLHGLPRHVAWRDSLARNQLIGPRLFSAGPIIDGDPPTRSTNVVVRTAAEADSVVMAQKAAGFDFIKVYDNVPADLYAVLAAAARRAGMPLVGHLPTPVGLERLLAVGGQRSIEHVEELLPLFRDGRDTAGVSAMARRLAEAGVWVTPTLTVHGSALAQARNLAAVRARPEMRYMNPVTERNWGWEPAGNGFSADPNARTRFERTVGFFEQVLVPALHRAGVGLLAGSDAPIAAIIPGFSIGIELRAFERAGLTRWEALRTATSNPAAFLSRTGEFGVIAVDAAADLVLLDANPLTDLAALDRPRGVMLRGRWLPRERLDALLAQLAAGYAR